MANKTFPRRIGQRFILYLALPFALVLLTGGGSLLLSRAISHGGIKISVEDRHIQMTEEIHSMFHHLIEDLYRLVATRRADRLDDLRSSLDLLDNRLSGFYDLHVKEEDFPEKEQEINVIQQLRITSGDLRAASAEILAALSTGDTFRQRDLEVLDQTSASAHGLVTLLNEIHKEKIGRLIQGNQRRMGFLVAAYLTFLVAGSFLIAVGSVLVSRTVILPLKRLASATVSIASGEFAKRVEITSRDEIGELSNSFNVMAERLEAREEELRTAHEELKRKADEAQALYRIGMEVAGLTELNTVLQQVVEKARLILRTDVATLCLFGERGGGLVVKAKVGAQEAFPNPTGLRAGGAAGAYGVAEGGCPFIRGEYRRSHLSAPLTRGEQTIGELCVGDRGERIFRPDEVEFLRGLGTQAAIAIENARLQEQLRGMAVVEERERIAREMHDGLAQSLSFLHLKASMARRAKASGDEQKLEAELVELKQAAEEAYEEVRQAIFGLRTMVSRGLGFVPTLTEYLHDFSQQTGIRVDLQVPDGIALSFSQSAEIQLIRIVQEALANVRKHAGASKVVVRFRGLGEDGLRVIIEDDGCGFDVADAVRRGRLSFGLQTMRERAEGIGGALEVESAPGRGTRVVVALPMGQ